MPSIKIYHSDGSVLSSHILLLLLQATRNGLSSKLDDSYHKCDDIVAYSNTTK